VTGAARAVRLLLAAGGLLLLLVVWSRGSSPPGPPAPLPRVAPATVAPPRTEPEAAVPSATRDVFRYADSPAPAKHRGSTAAPLAPPDRASPESALRLVGILQKGGTPQAVLALAGEVVLARVGERVGGYTVLWIDLESGVRVRDADGQEVTLPLPS
jgi:hypothetical protein